MTAVLPHFEDLVEMWHCIVIACTATALFGWCLVQIWHCFPHFMHIRSLIWREESLHLSLCLLCKWELLHKVLLLGDDLGQSYSEGEGERGERGGEGEGETFARCDNVVFSVTYCTTACIERHGFFLIKLKLIRNVCSSVEHLQSKLQSCVSVYISNCLI